jgi:hypothetical protein
LVSVRLKVLTAVLNEDFYLLGWHDVDWYMGTSISKETAVS